MKKILMYISAAALTMGVTSSCIQEFDPQSSTVTANQAANAPGSFQNFVDACTATLGGQFLYSPSSTYPYDFGFSAFFVQRDVMGQDMVINSDGSWFQTWYCSGTGLGPGYAVCQMPWTIYYGWIDACNKVIGMVNGDPSNDQQRNGAGIAHAMRAMYYMDLARMFAPETYGMNKESITVPIITEDPTIDLTHNPRATNEVMWAFILSDLDKAEEYLAEYKRSDVYTPDLSVVYGMKARAYLTMEDWPNAEKYAKMAQQGYTVMTGAQYTDRDTGFNTPNSSWMMALQFKADDPCILENDADSSWGSIMSIEIVPGDGKTGCGYAANYGVPMAIDRHLYETIPSTDIRKKCFLDFAIDDLDDDDEIIAALSEYSDYPEAVYQTAYISSDRGTAGGLSLKFRLAGGSEGHYNQYIGFRQSVPMMRVEEMVLIEAEAAGMQDPARGQQLLTAFALQRDPNFVYGTHDEAYGKGSRANQIQNEIWWQRRVEFWGEGLATFDIKRLNKGIIRSYRGTNHVEDYRWNTDTPPQWMTLCIVQTETNYNYDCEQNPTPIAPIGDSPEYSW